jgi:hypothetical protein
MLAFNRMISKSSSVNLGQFGRLVMVTVAIHGGPGSTPGQIVWYLLLEFVRTSKGMKGS